MYRPDRLHKTASYIEEATYWIIYCCNGNLYPPLPVDDRSSLPLIVGPTGRCYQIKTHLMLCSVQCMETSNIHSLSAFLHLCLTIETGFSGYLYAIMPRNATCYSIAFPLSIDDWHRGCFLQCELYNLAAYNPSSTAKLSDLFLEILLFCKTFGPTGKHRRWGELQELQKHKCDRMNIANSAVSNTIRQRCIHKLLKIEVQI